MTLEIIEEGGPVRLEAVFLEIAQWERKTVVDANQCRSVFRQSFDKPFRDTDGSQSCQCFHGACGQRKSGRALCRVGRAHRPFLQRTRCRLNGGTDFKPPGWLVSGNRIGVLTSWPDASKPLIQFERSNPTLNHLLESECRLTSAAPWLFRIGEDARLSLFRSDS